MIRQTELLGAGQIESILKRALGYSNADQTQVTVSVGSSNLTRFASSRIHQNVSWRDAHVRVRAIIGKKIGYAEGNSLDEDAIKATVEKAVEFARQQHENPEFVSLPGPIPMPDAPDTYSQVTANFTPEDRARAVADLVKEASSRGAEAAGSYSTSVSEYGVANSFGVMAYRASTNANLSTVVTAGTGFGYAEDVGWDISQIDASKIGREASETAVRSKDPESIPAGEYDVILLPYAAGELVDFLSWLGFGALAVQEGRSFMNGKFGQRICGENVTIWDDGLDSRGMVSQFDGEGIPKQKVDLIVNGVANAVVYDSFTAYKEGKESTGHGVGGTGTHGPVAWNLFLAPGDATVEDMIASTERGLFVTRFHYTNVIHPIMTVITGMTRDGTFLVENGKIVKPVKNLRFTENVLSALSNVEMIGKDLKRQSYATVPALKIKSFRFTGATEF